MRFIRVLMCLFGWANSYVFGRVLYRVEHLENSISIIQYEVWELTTPKLNIECHP
jgi:hypothetical protein